MENSVLIINSWIVVITWSCDPLDPTRAFTKYFHPNGKQISTWTEIESILTRNKISNMVDQFCTDNGLINWSN